MIKNEYKKIFDLFMDKFEDKKNHLAIITRNEMITYGELLEQIKKTVDIFKQNGIEKKDRVFIFLENGIEFSEAFMALNICNAVIIPIYVKLGTEKMQSIIDFYNPSYIVTDQKHLNSVYNETICFSNTKKIFVFRQYNDINVLNVCKFKQVDDTISEDVALILSSSGTTSDPKGIMLTNRNILSNTCEIARYMDVDMNDSILMIKSINHSSSITGELLVGLFKGCTIHVYNGIIHSQVVIDYLIEHKITIFFCCSINTCEYSE